jgi:mono/diheme cytochrome c family protein
MDRRFALEAAPVAGLIVAALLAVSCSRGGDPNAGAPPIPSTPAMTQLQRGEYIANITGCNDCHTPGTLYGSPDFSRALSGSELGWQGPWGVSYPRNLTPDPATGLGSWTDAEIERALRSGVKKDGSPLLPPMPWPDFAHMTQEDMGALIAYLRSIPPVVHKVPDIVPPGAKATGSIIVLPPPSAWDAPRAAQAAGAPAK